MKHLLTATLFCISLITHAQWQGTNPVYFNSGNVGIGTSSPQSLLHLNSAVERNTFRIYNSASATNYMSFWQGTGAGAIDPIGTGLLYLGYDQGTNVIIGKNGGGLGIGTSSPSSKLTIDAIDNYTDGITIQNTASYKHLITAFADGVNPSTGSALQFKVANNNFGGNTAVMTLKGSGNVGIGTTSPSNRLEVSGSTFNRVSAIVTADVQTGFQVAKTGANATNWEFYVPAGSTDFRFWNAAFGTDVLTLKNSGYVGIGTTSPQSKLDVNGDIQISNASIPMGLMTEVGGTSPLLNTSVNFRGSNLNGTYRGASFRIDTRDNFQLFQWISRPAGTTPGTGENILMSLTESGRLGIGTTNPGSYKLAVEGKIGAREVNVISTNPWPDYVFEKNYKLPSLEEIKNYIDQNQHLPEVPSAKEVEKNGVNLGEMNAVLLKKIEELTLYVIELKKENEALREQTSTIKKIQEEIQSIKKELGRTK